jgi:hypothetical protein
MFLFHDQLEKTKAFPKMDIRGQWSRKNTREISQQDSVDAYYKPIAALSLSSYKSFAVSCLFKPRNVVL